MTNDGDRRAASLAITNDSDSWYTPAELDPFQLKLLLKTEGVCLICLWARPHYLQKPILTSAELPTIEKAFWAPLSETPWRFDHSTATCSRRYNNLNLETAMSEML
jgi:hypothetical protein